MFWDDIREIKTKMIRLEHIIERDSAVLNNIFQSMNPCCSNGVITEEIINSGIINSELITSIVNLGLSFEERQDEIYDRLLKIEDMISEKKKTPIRKKKEIVKKKSKARLSESAE